MFIIFICWSRFTSYFGAYAVVLFAITGFVTIAFVATAVVGAVVVVAVVAAVASTGYSYPDDPSIFKI